MVTTITLRTPADIVTSVPHILGFQPAESVVMLTFGGPGFHARVDMDADTSMVAHALLDPCQRHRVESVIFVLISDDDETTVAMRNRLCSVFGQAGIDVKETIHQRSNGYRASGGDWQPLPTETTEITRLRVEAGSAPAASREVLRASIQPMPGACEVPSTDPYTAATAVAMVEAVLESDDLTLDALAVSRLVAALDNPDTRDAVMALHGRDNAKRMRAFWTDVVRRTSPFLARQATGLLGVSAWLSGDGAMGWVAVDHIVETGEPTMLSTILETCLTGAINPAMWEQFRAQMTAGQPA